MIYSNYYKSKIRTYSIGKVKASEEVERIESIRININFAETKEELPIFITKPKYKFTASHTARRYFATNLYKNM